MIRWVQEELRCIRGGCGEGEFAEKDLGSWCTRNWQPGKSFSWTVGREVGGIQGVEERESKEFNKEGPQGRLTKLIEGWGLCPRSSQHGPGRWLFINTMKWKVCHEADQTSRICSGVC